MIIKNKEIIDVLTDCGWSENRSVDISDYVNWYYKYGFTPSDSIIEFLTNFGGLTLKIPCYRYIKRRGSDVPPDRLLFKIRIDPTVHIPDTDTEYNVADLKEYLDDMSSFLNIKLLPIGDSGSDFIPQHYMGENGEFISAFDGECICLGLNFEDSLLRIMTDEYTDMEDIY